MGAAKKMRPPCSLGRGKENTLIYDSADIELLRFAAAAKNIPPDLQYRLSSRVWDREHIHTLCAQKLLAENRNHLSISLTLKGATGKYSAADPKYHGIHHDGDPQRSVGMRSRPAAGSGA